MSDQNNIFSFYNTQHAFFKRYPVLTLLFPIHRKLFVIPKLGKCWEFFPLLGNGWDNIFLSWETIGKSLGLFLPMLGSLWEMKQNIFLKYQCSESNGFSPQSMGKWWDYFFTSWEIFQHVIPNFGKCKWQEIPTLGKGLLKLGLRFPDTVFSLGKYAIQIPRSQHWETNGFISQNMGK